MKAELDAVRARRCAVRIAEEGASRSSDVDARGDGDDLAARLTGLALSGGGIRSATFALRVLQRLVKADLLKRFDYLSTVSAPSVRLNRAGAMQTKDRCRQPMVSAVAATHRASAMAVVSVATALLLATAMDARAQLAAIDASCVGGRFARVCDTQPDGGSSDVGGGGDDENGAMENDNRQNLLTSAYLGTAIDNFAGSEILTYLNPEDAGPTEQRLIFGFNFEFRLTGDRDKPTTPTNSQLWLYGETLHGVRSRDVECPSEGQAPVVCGDLRNEDLFPELDDIPQRAAFILKNATSFEGYVGLRWEFLGINHADDNQPDDTAAALYLKAQAGLLAIAPNEAQKEAVTLGAGSDSVDNHVVAVGVIATNGKMSGSYVEAGFGRTDLFFDRSSKRWKVDALLSFSVAQDWVSPFAQIVVDSDFGRGSDSIQSFFGIDFDVTKLLAF